MQVDVNTLYTIIVGTTFVGACLTAWQRRAVDAHRREMGFWAVGHALVGTGCLLRIFHGHVPSLISIGLSNLGVLAGYAAVTVGAMLFAGGRIPRSFSVSAASVAIGWLLWGQYEPVETRIVVTALVTAGLSFAAAIALGGRDGSALLSSRRFVRAMFALHGLFFLGRAGVTLFGLEREIVFAGANFAATMVEGILWSAFAPAALLMMVREKTEQALVAASETDFLTGVDNRRAFMAKAARAVAEESRSACVVLFDLDHFKTINDRHGHAFGDEVLRLFCRTLESGLMPGDLFGRLGGEEFAAVFANATARDAGRRASALARLYTEEIAARMPLGWRAKVSAGIAEAGRGASLDTLLGYADAALYRAKRQGRDRAVIFSEDGPAEALALAPSAA